MIPNISISKRLLRQKKFRQLILLLIFFALLIGFLIVPIEQNAIERQIINTWDGIYWAVTTFTTVGYGDVVPVTPIGRGLAMILQVIGAMSFGIIIAMIGSYVNRVQDEFYWSRLFERIDRIEIEVRELKKMNNYLIKNEDENKEED